MEDLSKSHIIGKASLDVAIADPAAEGIAQPVGGDGLGPLASIPFLSSLSGDFNNDH